MKHGDFSFSPVSLEDVKKEILNLNAQKSSTKGSTPATILKQCVNLFAFLTNSINYAICESFFRMS